MESPALILVDLQRDYLARPGLQPQADELVGSVAYLLAAFRSRGLPVAHVRTLCRADGADAMPHWRAMESLPCVEGTSGAEPPDALREAPEEFVAVKQYYSGFADPGLGPWLDELGVREIVLAGLYLHACVRQTAVDGYERGYGVVIASDAVGTNDLPHARATEEWLAGRMATFDRSSDVEARLPHAESVPRSHGSTDWPSAVVAGAWWEGAGPRWTHRDPCDAGVELGTLLPSTPAQVARAADAARSAQGEWVRSEAEERAGVLDAWADRVAADRRDLAERIVRQVGKPITAAREEVSRAEGHIRGAAALLRETASEREIAPRVQARFHPVGVVGAIAPWNNPLALACAKVAPAIAFGNGVVLKPAPQGTAVTLDLPAMLEEVGAPAGLVALVHGGATVGAAVAQCEGIDAVSVTGSTRTGRSLAAIGGRRGIPVQAEMGGNNAALVLADADLDTVVPALVGGAFAYSGQRCTALRRLVVHEAILDAVIDRILVAVASLVIGDPWSEATVIGPLIDQEATVRVSAVVAEAQREGCRVIRQLPVPSPLTRGSWAGPAVILATDRNASVVQNETFGPILVIQPARDLADGLDAVNGVPHGLLAALCSEDEAAWRAFTASADAGMLQRGPGPLAVHPEAPFSGWKDSGFGPAEHGVWDRDLVTRVQAVYGDG